MQHQNSTTNLYEKQEDLDILLNNLLQGIICINSAGIITTYNLAAEKMLGLNQQSALNSPFLNHFKDSIFGFSIQKALKEKKIPLFKFTHPYLNPKISGSDVERNLEIKCEFGKNELIIFLYDITDIKKTQKLAHANNRLKDLGGMTAMLAHEIRNPLGGIKGFASLLRRDLENEPNLRQMVDFIIEGTDNLNKLVTHVLNFAHPLDIQFISENLNELIANLKKTIEADPKLQSQISSENITIKIKTSADAIILAIDKELFRSCLLNLIINGIQAMPKGGLLTIWLGETDDEVIIQVIDTGIGISKENLKKIFSAFFTTKPDGNGFGLLEVYKVVQAHKGTIEVNSTPDTGTCFTIKIPKNR